MVNLKQMFANVAKIIDKLLKICYNIWHMGKHWFRHVLLGMTASGRHTLSAQLKLNDETNYGFAPAFA